MNKKAYFWIFGILCLCMGIGLAITLPLHHHFGKKEVETYDLGPWKTVTHIPRCIDASALPVSWHSASVKAYLRLHADFAKLTKRKVVKVCAPQDENHIRVRVIRAKDDYLKKCGTFRKLPKTASKTVWRLENHGYGFFQSNFLKGWPNP